jgi:hypothetical protein
MTRTPLTEHITLEEMTASHHGLNNDCPQALAANLLKTAQKAEEARAILSDFAQKDCRLFGIYGYRGHDENAACSGSETSAHMEALGVDFRPDASLYTLRAAWDVLRMHPSFMAEVDQLIIERGCLHIGLPTARHNHIPRHELRLDQDVNGKRTYPLFGNWEAPHA